jgi:hypothetical protein
MKLLFIGCYVIFANTEINCCEEQGHRDGICRHRASDIILPIIGLLLVVAVAFSLARGFSFLDTALTILVSQAILQGSYFLGGVIRAIFAAAQCKRPIL